MTYISWDLSSYPRLGPTYMPPAFEFTEKDSRKLAWCLDKGIGTQLCTYYKNTERGLECTAKNCPCELYEAE